MKRSSFSIIGVLAVGIVSAVAQLILKAIFNVEVEEYWNGRIQPYIQEKMGGIAMPSLPNFWVGFFCAVLLLFIFDRVWLRWVKPKKTSSGRSYYSDFRLFHIDLEEVADDVRRNLARRNGRIAQERGAQARAALKFLEAIGLPEVPEFDLSQKKEGFELLRVLDELTALSQHGLYDEAKNWLNAFNDERKMRGNR